MNRMGESNNSVIFSLKLIEKASRKYEKIADETENWKIKIYCIETTKQTIKEGSMLSKQFRNSEICLYIFIEVLKLTL